MGNVVANIAKGAAAEKIRDGANIQVIAFTGTETDANIIDVTTVTALIATALDEATSTGYARKSISNASVTLTVDNTNDRVDLDIADQTWTGVTGGSAWTRLAFVEDVGGADGTRVPLTVHDFALTPDGSDVTAQVAVFYRAS